MPLVEQEMPTLLEHQSSPPIFSGVRVTRSLVLYVCFVDRCLSFCTFSFGHCVVCSSSIYGFWLPLWYLQTLLRLFHFHLVETLMTSFRALKNRSVLTGPSWSWSHGSWIYIYLCNQFLSTLKFEPRSWRCVLYTTVCDQVYQWLATGRWFFRVLRFPPPIKLTATI